ncbi:MAG: PLP-dependent aspartate aminotransferase family protein [Actinomycetia bacterium]|nr:PLP-dependent aspartate aminotransferase family protein [Actinomycetes bacterium]
MSNDAQQPATRAITAGRSNGGRALAPTLWASSVWESTDLADANRRATKLRSTEFYGRYANPTVSSFEEAVAALEGAESSMAFASGMGAISSVVLALCSAGDHIVAQRQLYSATLAFLQGPCQRFGIEVTFVDGTKPGEFAAALRPGRTMLVIAETPTNPLLEMVDLDEIGALRGPITLVDSTFATPLGQQPLAHGVHLSLHSATKGIDGHNDATLGVVSGESDLLNHIWSYSVLHGATASPFDAFNALRGIRTLAVRTNQQAASALHIAESMQDHPAVSAAHYPGLQTHPQHDLAKRQMRHFGTVLAIDLAGGRAAAEHVLQNLHLAHVATSLGGPETIICHPRTSTHLSLTDAEAAQMGIGQGLLRISVGLEDPGDLLTDLLNALPAS